MLENGTKVAGYEIEGILGHGGMGVVYEARQLALGRKVALKILAGTLGMDPSFKERFRNEGRIQAAIDHPHIVTVFEAGEWEDSLFIAMRLVRGPNLKEMIIARELEGARTLRILRPIAEALDAAHEAGLIHRDIKPQNILVGSRDRAYLADFGLTKGIDDAGLTQTGQFVGTIDYISPEQIRGETTTSACDIYALAAVLYECLTGAVPYPKPSDAAVMYAHLSEPPPLVTEQRPELPPNLDEVICKAMDKDPGARHPTASAMIDDAEKALGKRVRAVITPPGPIEGPEEAGIREREARVPTRPERLRQPPAPATTPGVAAPAVAAQAGPPTVAARAATAAPPAAATEESAPSTSRRKRRHRPSPPPRWPGGPDRRARVAARGRAPAVRARRGTRSAEARVRPPWPRRVRSGARAERTTAPPAFEPEEAAPAPRRRWRCRPSGAAGDSRSGARAGGGRHAGPPALPAPDRARRSRRAPRASLRDRGGRDRRGRADRLPDRRPGDAETPETTSSAASSTLTSSTTAGALGLRFPSGWDRRGEAPEIPGMVLADQVAIGPTGSEDRGIVAGMAADAGGPRLLGPGFLASLEEPPRAGDRVRLGKVEALRYEGLEPKGFGGRALTVFAVPTERRRRDGRVLRAARRRRGLPRRLRARRRDARGRGRDGLPARRRQEVRRRPQRRDRRPGQAPQGRPRRARRRAHAGRAGEGRRRAGRRRARARSDLRGLKGSPAVAPAQAGIERALGNAATAYRRLARAPHRLRSAVRAAGVTRAERAVAAQFARLEPLGYAAG